jgi:hypothetical protein
VTTIPVTLPRPLPGAARVRSLLETDALPIGAIAACTALLALALPALLVQDSWLALVDGRLIAAGGLPHADTLTHWTLGRPWVDQQWGAHLVLYELAHHFGLRAVALFGVGCVVAALSAAAVAARGLGASPRSTAIGVLLPLVCAPWLAQVRTQSLALLPFVLAFALVAADSRRQGRRVYLVLPLLVLWANLHGSVALAAALVALYGLVRRRPLLVAAPACLLMSPYGLDLVGYYRMMLVDPPLASFVREWRPPGFDGVTVAFFVSALAVTVLWGRHRRVLTSFEQWAMPLLLLAALSAVRNVIWFELAAAVTLPRLLDAAWPARALTHGVRRVNLVAGAAAVLAVLGFVAVHRPALDPDRAAAATVAAAAGAQGIVLADDTHADWLLWEQPSLIGRVAYDVRFELFDARELRQLNELGRGSRSAWRTCAATARVVTFASPKARTRISRGGVLGSSARVVVDLPRFSAIARRPTSGRCTL